MIILLSSYSNEGKSEIPLTFILIAILFLRKEIIHSLETDQISHAAHVISGRCGAAFGYSKVYEKKHD